MEIPDIKIEVINWEESLSFNIKWESNLYRYEDVFKSILRFNWFSDDVISNISLWKRQ